MNKRLLTLYLFGYMLILNGYIAKTPFEAFAPFTIGVIVGIILYIKRNKNDN